ncbi:MAG: hypothetical protein JWL71_2873 [Acidobacteria bacterium]|nr:hypothetical protein [Acidobacteriota bacterium]
MSLDQLDTLEQQRREADRRYNEALTAFDAALVRAEAIEPPRLVADASTPPLPEGWRGRGVRAVSAWLMPWLERQQAFNARTAEAIEALTTRERDRSAAFAEFQRALIAFAQQITAFVETKDRQVSAQATLRLDEHQRIIGEHHWFIEAQRPLLAALPELRAHLTVLQRAMTMVQRRLNEAVPAVAGSVAAPAAAPAAATDDYKYVGFEDQFRGSDESVAAKLTDYLPIFSGAADVVDLGCGRGEFLAMLRADGVGARGVDTNPDMVAAARERGLDVSTNDALSFVSGLADASIGGAIATQVVEHLEPSYLIRLLDSLHRALRPGAPVVLETINPACWFAFFSSYIRDITHVQPVHPETLQYLVRASGFERVEIRYREPVPEEMKLKTTALPDGIRLSGDPLASAIAGVSRALDDNAAILNKLMFSHMDYAVVGYRI